VGDAMTLTSHKTYEDSIVRLPDLESILWVNTSQVAFVGVTAVRNCSFIRCEMDRVGFGGSPAQISDLRRILSGIVNGAAGPDRRS